MDMNDASNWMACWGIISWG